MSDHTVGENCKLRIDGNMLLILVDMSREPEVSKISKTKYLASSRGCVDIPGTFFTLHLNIGFQKPWHIGG